MAPRLRLLPIVMVAAVLLLGIKVADLFDGDGAAAIASAWAQSGNASDKSAAPPADKPAETSGEAVPPVAPAPAPASESGETPRPAVGVSHGEASPAGASAAGSTQKASAAPRDPLLMSPAEIDVLQHLSERRTELDKRAAGLRDQEVLMQAAEKRIEERIAKLQALEQSIDGSAQKQDDEDDARVKSLVHIYEAMKPAEAARIFDELEMPILLNVVEHMRETKAASILAAMDPGKAKSVTMALADRRAHAQGQAEGQAPVGQKPSAQANAGSKAPAH